MSTLTLVRHGQARMFDGDYDRLSQMGEEQAGRLGAYWAGRQILFNEIYSGPQKRQIHTAEIVRDCYARAGLKFPEIVVLDEMREYDGDGIINGLLPQLLDRDDRIRRLAEDYEKTSEGADRYRSFQRMFEAVTKLWVRGEVSSPAVESFENFHSRVRRGLERITSREGSGRRVAVFTSGGPTSVAVQIASRAPEAMVMELNWRVRNCSLTEIVFSRERFTLDVFNTLPHLDDPRMWTYR
ncbi:MAG: histidine phosphatase family protein [Acidobacteriota bacterium]